MNYFAQGFVQGLAGQLSTDINTRRQEAKDFFNKQVEIARTTGLENRRRVRNAVSNSVSTARQLNQMGVPKDIIMAVANQNPEDLGTFYEQISRAQAAGIETDEEFFRSFVEVGGSFQAPDEDFQTFFTRMYDPVISNAEANPEAFNSDKKGGIFASMFGLNAMENANAKLGRTEIVDGLTAEQLLQYGDDAVPNKVGGDAVVTFDYDRLAKEEKNAKGKDDLSISERNSINSRIEDMLPSIRASIGERYPDISPELFEQLVNQEVYKTLSVEYEGVEGVDQFLRNRLRVVDSPADDVGGATEAPEPDLGTAPAPEATEPVEAPTEAPDVMPDVDTTIDANQEPIDPTSEPHLQQIETTMGVLSFYQNAGPGIAIYLDENGNEVTLSVAQVRALAGQ